MAVDGAAATATATAAPVAASWLQEEVLAELQGPLALNAKPEVRCVWGRGCGRRGVQVSFGPSV